MTRVETVTLTTPALLGVCDTTAKLGFEAGDDFPVRCWEVWERIRADATVEASCIGQEDTDE